MEKIILIIGVSCLTVGLIGMIWQFGYDVGYAVAKARYNTGIIKYNRTTP